MTWRAGLWDLADDPHRTQPPAAETSGSSRALALAVLTGHVDPHTDAWRAVLTLALTPDLDHFQHGEALVSVACIDD